MRKIALPLLLLMVLAVTGCKPSTPEISPAFIQGAGYTEGASTHAAMLTQTAGPESGETETPQPGGDSGSSTQEPTPFLVSPTPTLEGIPVTAGTLPQETPSGTYAPVGTLFPAYIEDFEDGRVWAEFSTSNYDVGYSFGHYRFHVGMVTGNTPVFSIRQQEYRDVSLKVDIVRHEGPDNGYFGLLCRFIDTENYYRFVFAPDGSYSIGARVEGEYTVLAEGADEKIFQEDKKNTIRADCLGEQLALFINGNLVLNTTDVTFQSGFIGLVAGTPDTEGLIVYFDSFAVSKP